MSEMLQKHRFILSAEYYISEGVAVG